MKKFLALLVVVLMVTVACTPAATDTPATETPAEGTYADGKYFAMADEFAENGWKETVALVVKDGKIVEADWNAVSNQLGIDKRTAVVQGKYPMVAAGKAQAEWDVQADAAEKYLIELQDPTKIEYSDDEGHTDAISGVSIHVNGLFDLAKKALDAGVAVPGPLTDGTYHQEAAEFAESGWKEFVDFVVMNGNIVAVKWNAINKDDPELDKLTAVAEGKYPMVASGGAQAEWDVQAKAVEDFLLSNQNLALELDAEGYTDAISGVSIHVNGFYDLIKEALGL